MQQNLVHHGFDAAVFQNVLQVVHQEVGYADGLDLPSLIGILQRLPDLFVLLEVTLGAAELGPGLRPRCRESARCPVPVWESVHHLKE